MWCTTWLCRTGTSVIVSSWFFSIHWEDFSSFGRIHTTIWNLLGNEKKSLYFVTGSSEDFVIWFIEVSNGRIQLYMCERWENLMWLLNKRYLQNISVITELEKNGRKTNIKYYFTFMFVIYKYTNSDIMVLSKTDQKWKFKLIKITKYRFTTVYDVIKVFTTGLWHCYVINRFTTVINPTLPFQFQPQLLWIIHP